MHNLGHHHHQYQGGHEGYNGEQQWYHDPSSSNAGPQYGQGGQHQRSPSQTQSIDHSSRSGDSPLYYPQPKTPIIVNPVAIWESSEEQARRRAWAQQVRAPMEASHATTDPILGHSQPEAAVAAAAWGGAPPAAEYAVPHVMDQIDSSQLPAETPWKISHVRQRNRSEDAGIPQAPGGMQFKEGVATESNARDAAGQFLQRWHEAVVARKLHSQIDGIDVERLEHGVPKFERGTDAIRLETTVSCEAEDSKGERTVYRFTLSSTLDIGGAAQQQQQQQQQQMPQMSTQPGPATPAGGLGGSQFVMPAEYGTGVGTTQQDIQHDVHAYYNPNTANGTVLADNEDANVTILRQPVNYEEPTISRRSSFVQQQPGSLRGIPQMVNRTASMGHIDQFAEADARYWKLHRQLIDIEMNQRRQDEASHIDEVQQDRRSSEGWDEVQSEKIDLRSPPTPTIRLKSTAGSTGFGSYRRPSAFSIADPATFQQQQPEEEMLPVPASRPQGRRLSAETTTRPSYTTLSPNAPVPMPLETSVGESPTKHGKRGDIGLTLKRRSKSSPRLAMENARYHAPTSPLAPAGNTTGSPLIGHSSGGGSDEGLQKPSPSGDSAKVSVTGSRSSRVPSRSRSFSALRKIATHNSAQAATIVSPVPRTDPRKLKKPAKPVFLTSSSSEDEDDDKDGDEDDTARYFKSAIGRVPTPYPRGLLGKVNANDEDEGKVRSSEKPAEKPVKKEGVSAESMTLPLAAGGTDGGDSKFGHTRSSGLSETPGKQKMRPRINWGDEDDEPFPNDDDQSLDAQWLRIIKGGPPTRASVRPAGSSGSNTPQAPKANEHAEVEVQSEVNPKVSVVAIEDSAPETPAATKAEDEVEDIKVEGAMPVTDTAMAYKEEDNADEADEEELAPEVSTEAASAGEPEEPGLPETTDDVPISIPAITPPEQQPPRLRKRSSRSFPNLMDREFETISDSEADTSEMEIQQRFWSRAMKPSKSGSSTPHVPARRKSVVEMSHDISSEDLAAWMHWRDSTSPVGKPNREMVAAGNVNRAQQLITPPVSKGSDIDAVETLADREEDTATISGRCLDALTPHDELQLSMGRAYSKNVSAVGLQPEVPDTKVPTAADKVTVLVDPSTK
ncbi:hypothetical protein EC988_002993 [Linderina pennispora]|nr:hypothetical protein EC988_002993 [Linderina pennispora]